MTPRVAIRSFQAGELDEEGLLRALLSWPTWRVRVEDASAERPRIALLRTPTGGRLLELFSDDEAVDVFARNEGDIGDAQWRETPGWELLTMLDLEVIDRVNFDLHSPHRLYYNRDAVPSLRRWARTLRTEHVLAAPEASPDALGTIVAHPAWYVLLARPAGAGEGAEHAMLLAPDAGDRSIAAVYTAPDLARQAIDHYAQWMEDPIEVISYPPQELFALLAGMRLDGLVFNPFDERSCRAFRADVLGPIRERLGRTRTPGH